MSKYFIRVTHTDDEAGYLTIASLQQEEKELSSVSERLAPNASISQNQQAEILNRMIEELRIQSEENVCPEPGSITRALQDYPITDQHNLTYDIPVTIIGEEDGCSLSSCCNIS